MSDETAANLANSLAKHLVATLEASAANAGDRSAAGALARGRIFQLAGYYGEAAENYVGALSQDPGLDEAAARLVCVRMAEGRFEDALETATTLASRSPRFEYKEASSDQVVSVMTLVGDALAALGRTNDAIEAYKAARVANPKDTFSAVRLAQLFIATGQSKLAVRESKAVSDNTRHAGLAQALVRGAERAMFLPSIRPDAIAGMLRVSMPGRPVMAHGEAQVAPLIYGSQDWCINTKIAS
jgi:tetratricopeptide (TPR) repeat protein